MFQRAYNRLLLKFLSLSISPVQPFNVVFIFFMKRLPPKGLLVRAYRMFLFLSLFLALEAVKATHWAVLIAGSNTYDNYRHQSDVCHGYHTLVKNGIKPANIITFFYDDIVNSTENPWPGQVYNHPSKGKGIDVYKGCKKSYTGSSVNSSNFFNVLRGNSSAMAGIGTGEVLKSTKDDNVFIAYHDHGGFQIICTPVEGDYIYAQDLNDTLTYMFNNNMYKRLVFYLEACSSGSMFNSTLSSDINIYATTASGPDEDSWGWYCPDGGAASGDPGSIVNKKDIGACLGDLYSIAWLENTDSVNGTIQTLESQFKEISKVVSLSSVQQYGDLTFTNETVGAFLGNNTRIVNVKHRQNNFGKTFGPRDTSFYSYVYRWFNNQKFNNAWFKKSEFILTELRKRATWKTTFDLIGEEFSVIKTNTTCYKMVNTGLQNTACGTYNDWTLQYSKNVGNICYKSTAADILFTLDVICDHSSKEVNLTIQPNTIYTIYNSSNSAPDLFHKLISLV